MMSKLFNKQLYLAGIVFMLINGTVEAANTGKILDDAVVLEADTAALAAEADLFDTIRRGIALAIARCAGDDSCEPVVNLGELERIISTLNTRIGSLSQRFEESGETDLENIILSYADARDAYSGILEQLGLAGSNAEDELEDDLGEDEFDIFQDADEDL